LSSSLASLVNADGKLDCRELKKNLLHRTFISRFANKGCNLSVNDEGTTAEPATSVVSKLRRMSRTMKVAGSISATSCAGFGLSKMKTT
jgi:hypothetical protein